MRITLIGGVERNEQALEAIAASLGHRLDFHGGHLKGRGVDDLHRQVDRADLVVVATNVNSHGAAQLARKLARKRAQREGLLPGARPAAAAAPARPAR